MDESTIGSIRRRVPMLDREFYSAWKNEVLEIFNEYNLNKYITSPCAPLICLQRIYNFLLFHDVILSFLDVLQSFYIIFWE